MERTVLPDADLNILVVDDSRDMAESLAFSLARKGRNIQVTTNGLDALELASSFRPQVAFLDIVMPQMSGHELAKELRKQLPDILLVAVTGFGDAGDAFSQVFEIFDFHLMKPIDFTVVERLLR